MKKLIQFSFLYFIEKYHRFLFDEVLLHSEKRGTAPHDDAELILIWFFKKIQPKKWRRDLKHSKNLLNRAYNQKRLSIMYFGILFKFNKRNYVRYTG